MNFTGPPICVGPWSYTNPNGCGFLRGGPITTKPSCILSLGCKAGLVILDTSVNPVGSIAVRCLACIRLQGVEVSKQEELMILRMILDKLDQYDLQRRLFFVKTLFDDAI